MGQICRREEKEESRTASFQLSHVPNFQSLNFYFTINKLSRVDTECLIIFTDKKIKVDQNQYLKKCSRACANKVQEYLDVAILGQKDGKKGMGPGDCILLNVDVAQLAFSKICVVCLEVWGGQSFQEFSHPLQKCLQSALVKIKQQRMNIIAIVEFNQQFGLPNQVVYKIMMNALYTEKKGLKDIIFVCMNEQTMVEVKDFVSKFSHKKAGDSSSDNKSEKSSYF